MLTKHIIGAERDPDSENPWRATRPKEEEEETMVGGKLNDKFALLGLMDPCLV